ncbi:MAG: hypothetical protein V3T59_04465 [Desulfobacterales bacterium]
MSEKLGEKAPRIAVLWSKRVVTVIIVVYRSPPQINNRSSVNIHSGRPMSILAGVSGPLQPGAKRAPGWKGRF